MKQRQLFQREEDRQDLGKAHPAPRKLEVLSEEEEVEMRVMTPGRDREAAMRMKTIRDERVKEEGEQGEGEERRRRRRRPRKQLDCPEQETKTKLTSLNSAQARTEHGKHREHQKCHQAFFKRCQIALEPHDRVQDLFSGPRAAKMKIFNIL